MERGVCKRAGETERERERRGEEERRKKKEERGRGREKKERGGGRKKKGKREKGKERKRRDMLLPGLKDGQAVAALALKSSASSSPGCGSQTCSHLALVWPFPKRALVVATLVGICEEIARRPQAGRKSPEEPWQVISPLGASVSLS